MTVVLDSQHGLRFAASADGLVIPLSGLMYISLSTKSPKAALNRMLWNTPICVIALLVCGWTR